MANVLKHADDGADLSLIVAQDVLFLSCGQSHVWQIPLGTVAQSASSAELRAAVAGSGSTATMELLSDEGLI